MSSIEKVIEKFPEELRLPMYEALSIAIEESRTFIVREEISKVWEAIKELAEAQRKTEERVNELAEAQRKTEERLTKLEEKMAELAEAQRKTEERLTKLEEKMAELAEAQKKTEKVLLNLVKEHKETRRQLGGLQGTVGYTLENESFKHLPFLLKRDHKIEVKEKLKRTYIENNYGQMVEVNIYGIGNLDGEEVTIIGEAKSQLSKNEVNKFLKKTKEFEGRHKKIIPVIVTHMISSYDVEDYAKGKGIILYYSYDF